MIVKSIWISIFLIGFSTFINASEILKSDSIKISHIVYEFYDWYLTSINEHKYSEFKPKFVEAKNGMTTLDFSKYIDNLKKFQFSDSLILKEMRWYSVCIENLAEIKFSEFNKSTFTDLAEYEKSRCDFGNYYRWIGGQEPIDGIVVREINFISSDLVLVNINYFEIDTKENRNIYWGENSLTLKKIDNNWFIDKIVSGEFD